MVRSISQQENMIPYDTYDIIRYHTIPIRGEEQETQVLGARCSHPCSPSVCSEQIWNQVTLGHRPLAELLAKMVPSAAGL